MVLSCLPLVFVAACQGADSPELSSAAAPAATASAATASAPTSTNEVIVAHAAELIDTSTPQSWVAWGSYALVAEVAGEREVARGPLTGRTEEPVEVPSDREVELSIESILWTHPGAILPLEPGDQLEVLVGDGWLDADGTRTRLVIEGQVRLEVASRYVLVVGEGSEADQQSYELFGGSVHQMAEGTVDRPGSVIDGKTPEEIGNLLKGLTPDPAAQPVVGETLYERAIRVLHSQ